MSDLAQLISSGGVAALAVLVYLELRAIRPILRALERATAALLERERVREAQAAGVYRRAGTGPVPVVDVEG